MPLRSGYQRGRRAGGGGRPQRPLTNSPTTLLLLLLLQLLTPVVESVLQRDMKRFAEYALEHHVRA